MNEKIRQYLQAYQKDVLTAAEAKLGRLLSPAETAGIENLWSGLRLEGLFMAFRHPATSMEEVAEVLTQYAAQSAQEPSP